MSKATPPRTIIEALKNVKLASGPVERAWVMKPKKGERKKKKKKVKTVSGRGSCRIRYNRISSLRKINESAFDRWKTRFFLFFFFLFFRSVRYPRLGFHHLLSSPLRFGNRTTFRVHALNSKARIYTYLIAHLDSRRDCA